MLLARQLHVDRLVFSTDADYVYLDYKKPGQRPLKHVSLQELRAHYDAGEFPPGSMGPKVEAAMRFLENGGKEAVITSLETLAEAVNGEAGTHIHPESRREKARQ